MATYREGDLARLDLESNSGLRKSDTIHLRQFFSKFEKIYRFFLKIRVRFLSPQCLQILLFHMTVWSILRLS